MSRARARQSRAMLRQHSHWEMMQASPDRVASNVFHPYVPKVSQAKRRLRARQGGR